MLGLFWINIDKTCFDTPRMNFMNVRLSLYKINISILKNAIEKIIISWWIVYSIENYICKVKNQKNMGNGQQCWEKLTL